MSALPRWLRQLAQGNSNSGSWLKFILKPNKSTAVMFIAVGQFFIWFMIGDKRSIIGWIIMVALLCWSLKLMGWDDE